MRRPDQRSRSSTPWRWRRRSRGCTGGDHIIRVRAFSTPFGDMDDDGDYDDQVLELGQARDAHSRLALFLAQAPLMFDFFEIEFDPAAVAGRA